MQKATLTPEQARPLEAARALWERPWAVLDGQIQPKRARRRGWQCVTLGRAIEDAHLLGASYSVIARHIGGTPGDIHHLISLGRDLTPALQQAFQEGRLKYKEARALADLPKARQEALAAPFVSGRLSSCHIERFCALARRHPDVGVDDLISELLRPKGAGALPEPPAPPEVRVVEVRVPVDLYEQMMRLAGQLRGPGLHLLPEIERMRVEQAARILAVSLQPLVAGALPGNGAKAK